MCYPFGSTFELFLVFRKSLMNTMTGIGIVIKTGMTMVLPMKRRRIERIRHIRKGSRRKKMAKSTSLNDTTMHFITL